jgi:hypothetical protein
VTNRLSEPITVQWALHFGGDFFLRWLAEKWLLLLRKTDAVRREYGLSLESFLGLFNSLQQSSDSHLSSLRFASWSIRCKCGFNLRQTLLNWTLFQRAQQNASQVPHTIGDARVQLSAAKLINRLRQERRDLFGVTESVVRRVGR